MGQFDFSSPVAARNPCSSPQRALPSRVGRQAGLRPLPTDRRGRKHTRGLSLPVHPGRRRWTTCVALVYRPTHAWWNAGVVGRGRRSPTLRQHVVLIRTTLNVEGGQSMRTAVPPVSPRVRACRGTRSISARGSERALGGGLAAGRYQHRQSEPAGAGAGEQRCGFAPPLRAVCAQRRCASGRTRPIAPARGGGGGGGGGVRLALRRLPLFATRATHHGRRTVRGGDRERSRPQCWRRGWRLLCELDAHCQWACAGRRLHRIPSSP